MIGGRFLRLCAIAVAAALAAGCASDPITQVAEGRTAMRELGPTNAETVIAPGDRLRLSVSGDDTMNGEYGVDSAGTISIPLAGPVSVAGRTPQDAAKAIAGILVTAGLFRDPRVTVDVVTLRPFFILGEVNQPGKYPYEPGMSLFAAVATAGGYTYRANKGRVFIRKASETTEREFDIISDIAIMPGDTIRIPERFF